MPRRNDQEPAARARDGRDGDDEKKTLRDRLSRRLMRIPFLRRRYINRVLKYIDKSKAKGKDLPPQMEDLARFLSQVPKVQRAQRLEEAILAQTTDEPFNRELRRAAANQQRRSGKGAGGYRPGAPPRSMQPGPRVPKKPR